MGLDIITYSNLEAVGLHAIDCEDDSHIRAYAHEMFSRSFRGIPALGRTDDDRILDGGCYRETATTEVHAFRAGAYGGYVAWRMMLRTWFNPDREPDGPFYELIYFHDDEGCIGPEAAVDLLDDFRKHADEYAERTEINDFAREAYADWTRAMELASSSGLVCFT